MKNISKINQLKFLEKSLQKRLKTKASVLYMESIDGSQVLMTGIILFKVNQEIREGTRDAIRLNFGVSLTNSEVLVSRLHMMAHELIHHLRISLSIDDKERWVKAVNQILSLDVDEYTVDILYPAIAEEYKANSFASCIVRHRTHFFTYKGRRL